MYEFEKAIALAEKLYRHTNTKTELAEEEGITRVTLNRWLGKSGNDLENLEERYGDVYFNMWREGMTVDLIKEQIAEFSSAFSSYHQPVCSEGFLLMKLRGAIQLYTSKWYQQFAPRPTKKEREIAYFKESC